MSCETEIHAETVAAFRPVDRRGLDEWAEDNLVMGSWSPWPGKFHVDNTPWIREPMQRLSATGPKHVIVVGPAGGSKSMIGEALLAWIVDNQPGPTSWFAPTEAKAKKFSETRIQRVLGACARVARWFALMSRHARRTQEIHFPHMSLLIQAANETNAQSDHLRHGVFDEPWLYKPGMRAQLQKRFARYTHNSTILDVTTGPLDGDETDSHYKQGTQQERMIRCMGCGELHVPLWTFGKDKLGGVKWSPDAKGASGEWNMRKVQASTYYECPLCGHRHEPTAANAYAINKGCGYTAPSPDAMLNVYSFHWNCIVADFKSLGAIAVEYLEAKAAAKRGMMKLLQEFHQKRLALAWKEELPGSDITQALATGYKMLEPWADEFVRFMTVDVQATHFWVTIRLWSKKQESRLFFFCRAESWGEVREIQLRHGVQDTRVLVDSGHFTDAAYTECAFHGWYAIKGEPAERGYRRDIGGGRFASEIAEFSGGNAAHSRTKYFPVKPRPGGKANWCHLIKVSDVLSSEVLGALRGGNAGWTAANDTPQDWREQMAAVVFYTEKNAAGRAVKKSKTVGKCGEHAWDTERYQLAAAVMSGVLKISTQPSTTTTAEEGKEEAA